MLVAAVARLWGLGGQPILYFDSGVYLGEGAFLASAAQRAAAALVSQAPGSPLERVARATQEGTAGHSPDIAKPGHAILLALAFLALGKGALAGGLVSALSGIGTVAATWAVGMHGWGPRVALPAAALLAISGQHLVYSREPLVEADGLLFAMLASLVYLKAKGARGLIGAGLLWGLAFTCNNRMSYLPAIFVIAELARWPGWRGLMRRGSLVATGFAVPLVVIEAAYLAARAVARTTNSRADWLDYAQQLVAFTRMNPPDRVRFDEWPTYFVDVALMDGLAVLALLLLGIGVLVWRLRGTPTRADLLLAGSLLVPLALYSVYSTGEVRLRHFSLAIPWAMLAAALALERLSRLAGRRQHWMEGAATLVLVGLAVPRLFALDLAPAGMQTVANAVGTGPVAGTNGPVLAFYVGEERSNARLRDAFVNVPSDLSRLAQRYPALVVDMQAAVFPGDLTDIYARTTPTLTVPNGSDAWYLADLLEHYGTTWGSWGELLGRWRANTAIATEIRVYQMGDLLPKVSG
jgi:4-amino-4-deoxy-L-arabinose transferase-like glycosyltransferase